jgi:hypothetical protein
MLLLPPTKQSSVLLRYLHERNGKRNLFAALRMVFYGLKDNLGFPISFVMMLAARPTI